MNGDQPDFSAARRQKLPAIDLSKLDRLPPHSLEAEQGVLGCIMLSPKESLGVCLEKAGSDAEMFYDLRHQALYEVLLTMYDEKGGNGIDLITVQQRLKDINQLEGIGGLVYLSSLMDAVPSAANLTYYLDAVIEKSVLRKMLQTCTHVLGRVHEHEGEVDKLIDEVERDIMRIRQVRLVRAATNRKDSLRRVVDTMDTNRKRTGAVVGIPTPIAALDRMTNGWKPGKLYVIAALAKWGKSSLVLQFLDHACGLKDEKGKPEFPAALFSLEMPQDDVNERSICRESGVPSHELANPSSIDYDAKDINVGEQRVRQMKWSRITDAMVKLAKQPLTIIDEPGISIGKLRAVARRLVVEKGVKLIGVDYLQLMEGSKESRGRAGSREQEISSISKGLKALAMELNIPVIALAQLNREFEKSEGKRRPRLADLRESGSIGQDADCVIVIHGKDDQIEEAHAEAEISVIANRGGPSGSVDVLFEKPVYRFTDNRHAVAVA